MRRYFINIWEALFTVAKGMAVTLVHFTPARKSITVQYPDRTPMPVKETLPERYRGTLTFDPDCCTGCTRCALACPIDCITIDRERVEGAKGFVLKQFDIDIAKCMYCGLCVEACPVSGLVHSHEFEGATGDLRQLTLKFISEEKHKELREKALKRAEEKRVKEAQAKDSTE
jgi:formate hydrogenlyase subunit 6/NADH:ubiquinone oxidoreductase subunit I